jgi:hypothetical protein
MRIFNLQNRMHGGFSFGHRARMEWAILGAAPLAIATDR